MSTTKILFSLIISITSLAVNPAIWFTQSAQTPEIALSPENTSMVARGKVLYDANCAPCHGKNLEGQKSWRQRDAEGFVPASPHDQSGHTWHRTDQLLFELTKFSLKKTLGPDYKTRMPAYEEVLSNHEILAVLSYIKSRWPEKLQEHHDQLNARAKRP